MQYWIESIYSNWVIEDISADENCLYLQHHCLLLSVLNFEVLLHIAAQSSFYTELVV